MDINSVSAEIIGCNQCAYLVINGVFCHELGCPNHDKRWDGDQERWIDENEDDEATEPEDQSLGAYETSEDWDQEPSEF